MNIILISTECVPFASSTELSDIVCNLAKSLEKEGNNVKVIMPRYASIEPSISLIEKLPFDYKVNWADTAVMASVFKGILPKSLVSVFFIESQSHFSNSKEIYLSANLDEERFSFFSHAAVELISKLDFDVEIINVLGSQVAEIPTLLRSRNFGYAHLSKIPIIYSFYDLLDSKGNIRNNLKNAIRLSDYAISSSESYTKELLSNNYENDFSEILKKKEEDLKTIEQGIDNELFNPETDDQIAQTFSASYISAGKKKCKEEILEITDLEYNISMPLIGIVLNYKNSEMNRFLLELLSEISMGIQVVVHGDLDGGVEKEIGKISSKSKNVKICPGYDYRVAKKIYAGCDFYLNLNKYNPSVSSMISAMRYGCVPITYLSGAVKDIVSISSEDSNAIVFDSYTKESVVESLNKAVSVYKSKELWTKLVKQAMAFDSSQFCTAKHYIECYQTLINKMVLETAPR